MADCYKKIYENDETTNTIEWECAEEEIPGITDLLNGLISNISCVSGKLYDQESDPYPNDSDVNRDESVWWGWEGYQFDFHWKAKTFTFVTRRLKSTGQGPDCVLKRCAMINEPFAQSWPDEGPWSTSTEKLECKIWAVKYPNRVWELAAYVVNCYSNIVG